MAGKHTPGPWTVIAESRIVGMDYGAPRVWTRAEDKVVDLEVCALNPFEEWEGQRLADAHLIAAAPELLEACEALLRRLKVIIKHFPHVNDGITEMVMWDAEKVIRKAKGENRDA